MIARHVPVESTRPNRSRTASIAAARSTATRRGSGTSIFCLAKRTAENLARLGAGLRTRPLLRAARRSGRVRIRAAETVLPVAVGEAEALWVERACVETVRELVGSAASIAL